MKNVIFDTHTIEFSNRLKKLHIATKHPVIDLFAPGKREKTVIKELKLPETDIKGLYVFWKEEEAVYVGISKNVIKRLVQHVKGTTHHSATFPIKILKTDNSKKYKSWLRKEFVSSVLKPVQEKQIQQMKVSFIAIEHDVELYLFEVYCALELKCRYNTFETH